MAGVSTVARGHPLPVDVPVDSSRMRGEEDGWSETSILKRASKYSPDENPDESEGFYFLFQSSDAL